jgi:Holliday junction resolvasome RuvABC endonuclease subunit
MAALTIAGIDPGSRNCAFSVVKVRINGPFDYRIKEVGMIKNTMKEMKGDVRGDLMKFRREFNGILKRHKVDVVLAERYMNRGIRGNTGELVGLMLGVVAMASVQDVTFIPASQWKNAYNRNSHGAGKGKEKLEKLYKDSRLVPHVIDASCIALYGGCTYLDEKPFEFLSARKALNSFRIALDKADIKT